MTNLNRPLAQNLKGLVADVCAMVAVALPNEIESELGMHDVWYGEDDGGLYACIEFGDLFPGQLVSELDDRDAFPALGWRVDLPKSVRAILEAREEDIADHRS